ncbi:MAG: VanZ family protein [Pyrinomonadaceae bacterium]
MVDTVLQKKWRGRILRYAPLVLWIGVILFASTSLGAMSNTSRIIRPLLHFLFPDTPEEILVIYHGYIRKLAHLTEYSILAFFASRAFWSSTKIILQRYWYAFSFLTVVFVASIDEYNQSFDMLRTGTVYDVLLDVLGGIVMIIIFFLYKHLIRR